MSDYEWTQGLPAKHWAIEFKEADRRAKDLQVENDALRAEVRRLQDHKWNNGEGDFDEYRRSIQEETRDAIVSCIGLAQVPGPPEDVPKFLVGVEVALAAVKALELPGGS